MSTSVGVIISNGWSLVWMELEKPLKASIEGRKVVRN